MSQFKTKEFLDLKSEWYKKLAKKGFQDVEQDEDHLKLWTCHFFQVNYGPTAFEAKETYYRMAGHFLHEHPFKSDLEKRIWELHCQGLTIRKIAATLSSRGKKISRSHTGEIVKSLSDLMVKK